MADTELKHTVDRVRPLHSLRGRGKQDLLDRVIAGLSFVYI